jgi:hypothetical protein
LFSHAVADDAASAPLTGGKASHENLFSQPSTDDIPARNEVAQLAKPLPRNPFQVG